MVILLIYDDMILMGPSALSLNVLFIMNIVSDAPVIVKEAILTHINIINVFILKYLTCHSK